MKGQTGTQEVSGSSGFIREGFRELGRKLERRKLRKQAQHQEQAQSAALVQLGQRAWQEKIDLAGFAGLRDQLAQLEGRAGELSASMQKLESERASLEARQKEEIGKFDGQRKAVEERKGPVDASLRTARQRESEQQRTILRITARQANLAAELASLEQELASLAASAAPDQARKLSAAQTKKQPLLAEQTKLAEELPQAQAAVPVAKAEVDRLSEESRRYEAEINRIEAERQAALSPILAELQRVGGELGAARQQASAVEQDRTERFKQLGLALYESKSAEPALAQSIGQIAATDRARAATQAALEALLALTRTMLPRTMLKFWSTVVLLPVLLIGLGCGIYAGWTWWEGRHPPKEYEAGPQINPYLSHPLSQHPAYVLANRLAKAKDEQQVANLMLEAFRAIHLGVYTHDGRQILAGAERSQNDFFLYDFQWKILARAFFNRNGMRFADHSRMLGKALLELEDPALIEPVLARAIARRYQEAYQNPDDPMSFLILLVDGLARQQVEPYSLNEDSRFSRERTFVDPLQSFLIMLDFFTRPPAPKAVPAALRWLPSLATTAYAASPCDGIAGDEGQGYWGRGTDIATELGEKISGAAGKVLGGIGQATGILGAIGDLLTLYGMTIKLEPEPDPIHLLHDDDYTAWITATVTFNAQGVPDQVLKCGWLAGKQMPANGPLKDVELEWKFYPDLPPYLEMSGKMWYGWDDPRNILTHTSGGLRTKTNEGGASSFLIQPKNCPDRRGKIVGRDYMAVVTARYVTMSAPTPGLLGWSLILKLGPGAIEYLMHGRTGRTRFRAEWHKKAPKAPQYGG
jgi:hypothetical protein